MRGKLGDRARLNHILDSIKEIEAYVSNSDKQSFMGNSMMRFASIKQIEIIGEASNNLSPELKNQFPNVEWRQIVGMRHIFVHEYFGIDSELLWQIIHNDLTDLKQKVKVILDSLE